MQARSARLDIVRIFAALSVMGFHLGTGMWMPDSGTAAGVLSSAGVSGSVHDNFWWGWIGVPIFYTLSGYLIAARLQRSASSFLWARLSRLIPGAIASATLTGVLLLTLYPATVDMGQRFLSSIVLWPFGPWVDSVYWTLGIEMSFYALVALLLWRGHESRLETVILGVAAISATAWAMSTIAGIYAPKLPFIPDRVLQLLLVKDGIFFAAGVVIFGGIKVGWDRRRVTIIAVLGLIGCLPIVAEAIVRATSAGLEVQPLWACCVWLLAMGLMAVPSTKMSGPVLSFLSKATYPLYLIHSAGSAVIIVHLLRSGMDRYQSVFCAVAVSIIAALVITAWLEPMIRERLFPRRRRAVKKISAA